MKHLIRFFVIVSILAAVMLSGCNMYRAAIEGEIPASEGICTGPTRYVDRAGKIQIMEDPGQSTLCKINPYPTTTKLTLFAVNDAGLRSKTYASEQVFEFTAKIRGFINEPVSTVKSVILKTAMEIKQSPELFIFGNMIEDPLYQVDLPIDDFTRFFLLKHLNEQDAIAMLFKK